MFGNSGNGNFVEVSIEMLDGDTFTAAVVLSQGNASLDSVFAKPSPFLEIKTKAGLRKYIAKSQIASVEPVTPLAQPTAPTAVSGRFRDACVILGVRPDSSFQDARRAFHELAKMYHPDAIAGTNLPPEVVSYMNDMFQQVNAAFREMREKHSDTV